MKNLIVKLLIALAFFLSGSLVIAMAQRKVGPYTGKIPEIDYQFINATKKSDMAQLKFLIDNGADINYVDPLSKKTALEFALDKEDWYIINWLISQRVNTKVSYKGKPLSQWANEKLWDLLEKNEQWPMKNAHQLNEIITILLVFGADIKSYDVHLGLTPLNLVAIALINPTLPHHITQQVYEWTVSVAKLLLDKGADINAQIKSNNPNTDPNAGDTPLISAIKQGNKPLAELLLSRGADISKQNAKSQTALTLAAGKPDILALLQAKAKAPSAAAKSSLLKPTAVPAPAQKPLLKPTTMPAPAVPKK